MGYLRWCLLLGLVLLSACGSTAGGDFKDGDSESSCWVLIAIFSALDWFFGVNTKGPAPFEILGIGLNVLIPGSVGILGTIATTWASLRGKKWKRAFTETAQVIETAAANGMSAKDMKPHLGDAHAIAGVLKLVAPVVEKIQPDEVTP